MIFLRAIVEARRHNLCVQEGFMKAILSCLLLGLLVGCATTHKERSEVKDIDTKLDEAQDVNGEKLGIKDDTIVIQKKRLLAEELRELQNYTYGLEAEVYGSRKYGSKGLYGVYRDCQAELSSSKYGGNGELPYIEPAERLIEDKESMTFGKDEDDKLVSVTEEFISERIDRFKKSRESLEKRRAEYELKVRVCKNKLKNAKEQAE